jgi:hypothetical protein
VIATSNNTGYDRLDVILVEVSNFWRCTSAQVCLWREEEGKEGYLI